MSSIAAKLNLARGWDKEALSSAFVSSLLNLGKYSSVGMALSGGLLSATASLVDSFVYPNLLAPALKNTRFCEGEIQDDIAKLSTRVIVVLGFIGVGAKLLDLTIGARVLIAAGLIKIIGYALFKGLGTLVTIPEPVNMLRDLCIGDCDSDMAIPFPMMI